MTTGSALRQEKRGKSGPTIGAGSRPIDLVHLSRQAGCDSRLEREVLVLLVRQLDAAAPRLADLAFAEARGLLHAIEGTALNVGAFPLAEAVARYRRSGGGEAERSELLSEIERVSDFARMVVG